MTAKAYRLLRAILMTAVDDGLLSRNPCRIRGAGAEPTAERPVRSVGQVFDLAERMPQGTPFGLRILVTTFGSLRWGVADDPEALVFTGDLGGPMHPGNFNKRVGWTAAVAAVGVPGLHFHDLRHTGNTFAAMTGATLRDLMTRMGHDSMRAALIYQHNTQGADRKIADAMEAMISKHDQDGR